MRYAILLMLALAGCHEGAAVSLKDQLSGVQSVVNQHADVMDRQRRELENHAKAIQDVTRDLAALRVQVEAHNEMLDMLWRRPYLAPKPTPARPEVIPRPAPRPKAPLPEPPRTDYRRSRPPCCEPRHVSPGTCPAGYPPCRIIHCAQEAGGEIVLCTRDIERLLTGRSVKTPSGLVIRYRPGFEEQPPDR